MNLIQRFKSKTPAYNKKIGRFLTAITGVVTILEGVFQQYPDSIPKWLHWTFVGSAIITALMAAYHGQKVKK